MVDVPLHYTTKLPTLMIMNGSWQITGNHTHSNFFLKPFLLPPASFFSYFFPQDPLPFPQGISKFSFQSRKYSSAISWLAKEARTYFSKKGEIVFRVSNFPGGMLRSLPYSSKVEVVIPLWSLWTYDHLGLSISQTQIYEKLPGNKREIEMLWLWCHLVVHP